MHCGERVLCEGGRGQSQGARAAQAKGLELTTTIEPDLPPVLVGDAYRLNQVLANLLTNAVKFTEEGGVSVRFYLPDPEHWALQVSDTGSGISPEAQKQIFEPFWQVDHTIGRKYGGAGLGLSIVQKLVDLMNGEITLKSEAGVGSSFVVELPLRLPEESPPQMTEERLR